LVEKNEIIQMYLKGETQLAIAESLGITRQTAAKYINAYERDLQKLEEAETIEEKEEIIIKSQSKPVYDSSKRQRFKLTPEVEELIDKCLAQNEVKTQNGHRKVLMKKVDIHEYLLERGHDISYGSVCQYVTGKSKKPKEAFIRQSYDPGMCVEFDWGEITLFIDSLGGEVRLKMGVFTLKYSDYRWAKLYLNEKTESFLDIHVAYFEAIGGVPAEVVYDNALVNVQRMVGKEKKPTPAVVQLSGYYGYSPRYTNFYSGNEKGNVERSVEVVRRKAFSGTNLRFDTIADAESALSSGLSRINAKTKQLTEKSADAAFVEEKTFLLPARLPMDPSQQVECLVNKYSFIYVGANFYSVPDYLVGRKVQVKKYPLYLQVYYEGQSVLKVDRIRGRNEYKIDISHYLNTLKKKPGAIAHSLALKQAAPWLQEVFHLYYGSKAREYILLLELINEFGLQAVQVAVKQLELKKLPVENSYIRHEVLRKKVPLPSLLKSSTEIQDKCLDQLSEISSLYGQGATLCLHS